MYSFTNTFSFALTQWRTNCTIQHRTEVRLLRCDPTWQPQRLRWPSRFKMCPMISFLTYLFSRNMTGTLSYLTKPTGKGLQVIKNFWLANFFFYSLACVFLVFITSLLISPTPHLGILENRFHQFHENKTIILSQVSGLHWKVIHQQYLSPG